eukprot:c24301_g3_i5 orf=603-1067(-)
MGDTVEHTETELRFMRLALDEARDALTRKEVPVGCVLVEKGQVIASGSNRSNETRNEWAKYTMVARMTGLEVVVLSCLCILKDLVHVVEACKKDLKDMCKLASSALVGYWQMKQLHSYEHFMSVEIPMMLYGSWRTLNRCEELCSGLHSAKECT